MAAELDIHSAEEHPPHIVLALIPGIVADPDRTRSLVPGQMVDSPLGQVAFPADAVHDLQLERPAEIPAADRIDDEPEVLHRFPVEPEPVQGPQHERRVADPAKPVVPVRAPPGVSGSDVVAAAMIAPVGAKLSALSVRALRPMKGFHGWSAIFAELSQSRQ